MRIGITGGAGFIGLHVADLLHERGDIPVLFDRQGRIREDYEVFMGDVTRAEDVVELAAHVDGIIHLAAVLGTQETITNPRPSFYTNIMGGLNVFEAVVQYDLPCVYIGVGNHWMFNSYSISKTCVERAVTMYNRERNARINVVRAVNAYGPRQSVAPPFGSAKVRKITPAFICRVLSGMPIEVYGDGEQVSDMVYVRDLADALVRALDKAQAGCVFDKVVECGPANHHTVNQVAETVIDVATTFGYDSVDIVHLPMRPGEIPGAKVTADTSTLSLVNMHPDGMVSLWSGMKTTVNYFIENQGKTWK